MARTTQPTIAQAIGTHRRAARLSYYALAVELVPLLPARFRPSPEKLRRMEAGLVDENEMDPIVLAALAKVFGVSLSQLSPEAATTMKFIGGLCAQTRCTVRESYQPIPA